MREETDRTKCAPGTAARSADIHADKHRDEHPPHTSTPVDALVDTGATQEASPSLFQAIRQTILHALSQHERLLVVLWYVERMSIGEIAEVLDLTDQQVRRTHEHIVERLREAVAPVSA